MTDQMLIHFLRGLNHFGQMAGHLEHGTRDMILHEINTVLKKDSRAPFANWTKGAIQAASLTAVSWQVIMSKVKEVLTEGYEETFIWRAPREKVKQDIPVSSAGPGVGDLLYRPMPEDWDIKDIKIETAQTLIDIAPGTDCVVKTDNLYECS